MVRRRRHSACREVPRTRSKAVQTSVATALSIPVELVPQSTATADHTWLTNLGTTAVVAMTLASMAALWLFLAASCLRTGPISW